MSKLTRRLFLFTGATVGAGLALGTVCVVVMLNGVVTFAVQSILIVAMLLLGNVRSRSALVGKVRSSE